MKLRKQKCGWVKNNGYTQYANFFKLTDALTYITEIDNIIMIASDILRYSHIKKAFYTVGNFTLFLLGIDNGNVIWQKSIDRRNMILDFIKKTIKVADRMIAK